MLRASESENTSLNINVIIFIFKLTQTIWSQYLNVTNRQADEQTTCNDNTVLCVASRGKNRRFQPICIVIDADAVHGKSFMMARCEDYDDDELCPT